MRFEVLLLSFVIVLGPGSAAFGSGAADRTGEASPTGNADALWAASKAGDVATVERLLAAGVDPNVRYEFDFNALLYAAIAGHEKVVRVLLEHGAEVDAHDSLNHFTPLAMASTAGHCGVVARLMEHGADPNRRDFFSRQTPLWFAANKGFVPCVEALLAGDVAAATLDEAGSIARRRGRDEVAELIRQRRAGLEVTVRWPQFRGPGASGVADGARPPLSWSDESGILWQTEIPGLGHASPVLWGDRLFVLSAVAPDQAQDDPRMAPATESLRPESPLAWKLHCLDRVTGSSRWQRTVLEGTPPTGRHPVNSYASSSPAADGDRVVVLVASRWLVAFDHKGEELWRQDLGVINAGPLYDAETHWGSASSPVIAEGRVVVQVDRQRESFLAAFDAGDGRRLWRTSREEPPSWGTPTILQSAEGSLVITNGARRIVAYELATGAERWFLRTDNSQITASTPIVGLGLVFVANGFRPLKPIYAIRPDGRGDLTPPADELASSHVAWSHKSGGPYFQTPLLYGEHLYVLTDHGVLSCYYAKSGELVYRQRVGKGARFFASPVAADGHLFLTSEGGEVFVVRSGIEFDLRSRNEVGDRVYATPAIADGMLYFRGRERVVAIGREAASGGPHG